jgi:hypothetical protein
LGGCEEANPSSLPHATIPLVLTVHDILNEVERLMSLLDIDHQELVSASEAWAEAENDYRRAKAQAYLRCKGTVDERKAFVDLECESERLRAHLAEGSKVAALEKLRNTRQQLSACQSAAQSIRSEMQLAGKFD